MRQEMMRFVDSISQDPNMAGELVMRLGGRGLSEAVEEILRFAHCHGYAITAEDLPSPEGRSGS